MKLLREVPEEWNYVEAWPFACPLSIYRLKRKSWLDAGLFSRNAGDMVGNHVRRLHQVELLRLRDAFWRPPSTPYPYGSGLGLASRRGKVHILRETPMKQKRGLCGKVLKVGFEQRVADGAMCESCLDIQKGEAHE